LRAILSPLKNDPVYKEIVDPRNAVLARFQPVFTQQHIPNISEEEFRSFLLFKNNRHWNGLHRQWRGICSDMPRLREALSLLVDESRPLIPRLDEAIGMIPGMGKAIVTAILLVAYPAQYGVWNNTSEAGLNLLEIWPQFDRGESFGSRYDKVNKNIGRVVR